jgi:hypothetical protein
VEISQNLEFSKFLNLTLNPKIDHKQPFTQLDGEAPPSYTQTFNNQSPEYPNNVGATQQSVPVIVQPVVVGSNFYRVSSSPQAMIWYILNFGLQCVFIFNDWLVWSSSLHFCFCRKRERSR